MLVGMETDSTTSTSGDANMLNISHQVNAYSGLTVDRFKPNSVLNNDAILSCLEANLILKCLNV